MKQLQGKFLGCQCCGFDKNESVLYLLFVLADSEFPRVEAFLVKEEDINSSVLYKYPWNGYQKDIQFLCDFDKKPKASQLNLNQVYNVRLV